MKKKKSRYLDKLYIDEFKLEVKYGGYHWFYSCYDEYYEFTLDEYKGSKHWEYYYDWLNDISRIREEKLNQILGISKNNPTIGDLLKSIILK